LKPLVADCTELYHLASYVGVRLASQTSSQTILNNLRSIDTILELATRYKPRFLLTSTSEIYGKALDGRGSGLTTLDEQADRVYGPTEVHRWSYSGIKAVEEFLTHAKVHEEGLRAVIVRLFNVIGPRQQGLNGPVVPRLIEQALSGKPLTVYNDGRQLRCFTDVKDAIHAITTLMRTDAAVGEVFNVGSDTPTTIRTLAETILELTGSGSEIDYIPYESVYGRQFEDVVVRVPEVSKLREFTGLACTRPLKETLSDILEYYRQIQASAQ
jgi:UDP-glucose 4-epimerase